MTAQNILGDGTVRDRLALAVAQLNADTPYTADLVVQDVAGRQGHDRLFQDYRGDLSGRFLGAVAVAHRQSLPYDRAKASSILSTVLDNASPDGSFGAPSPAIARDHGAAWGHGRLLQGLLSARVWAPDPVRDRLNSAIHDLAGFLVSSAPGWARWLSETPGRKFILDPLSGVLPLVSYGTEFADEATLDAVRMLIDAAPTGNGGLHGHGYLLFLRGTLAYALARDDDELLNRVRGEAEKVHSTFTLPSGSTLESLAVPRDINTEGCGTADWVMLNLELFRAGDSDMWLDRAVVATVNGLLHSQSPSGHFGCETLLSDGEILLRDYAPEAWWCCTFHGIEALGAVADHAVARSGDAWRIDIPTPIRVVDPEGETLLSVTGDFPFSEELEVSWPRPSDASESVGLRVPGSVTVASTRRGENERPARVRAGILDLTDSLRSGGRAAITLRRHVWFLVDGVPRVPPFGNTTAQAPDFSASSVAIFSGPLLLAATADDNRAEDVLRAVRVVHPRDRLELDATPGEWSALCTGYDSFQGTLTLTPIGSPAATESRHITRISFRGLIGEPASVHGLYH